MDTIRDCIRERAVERAVAGGTATATATAPAAVDLTALLHSRKEHVSVRLQSREKQKIFSFV
jgi:hypothetical protein